MNSKVCKAIRKVIKNYDLKRISEGKPPLSDRRKRELYLAMKKGWR